ncbi:hypothetical protein ACS0TY_025590 [Phlomoides rotata]
MGDGGSTIKLTNFSQQPELEPGTSGMKRSARTTRTPHVSVIIETRTETSGRERSARTTRTQHSSPYFGPGPAHCTLKKKNQFHDFTIPSDERTEKQRRN